EAVTRLELEERVDGRVGERARWIGLDRHAALEHVPALAEAIERRRERAGGSGGRAGRDEKSLLAVERRLRGGEAFTREHGGEHAVSGGRAGVIRLGHRAEVLLQARRERDRQSQRVLNLAQIEAEQTRRRGRAADRADR